MWRIDLLGGLRVSDGTRVIDRFPTQRTAALLAYLVTFSHRAHSREVLADLLWPDAPPESQRHSLRLALSRLRRLLGDSDLLEANRLTVRALSGAFVTDVALFESALARGDSRAAARLYQGPFLPGFYDDWIQIEQDRLALLRESLRPGTRSLPATLPTYWTSLVGREADIDEVRALLASNPWVTLIGPGGIGKTRLAIAIAHTFERAAFAPLVDLSEPEQVPDGVRTVLQIPVPAPGFPVIDLVMQEVRELAPLLLVFDNAEHLVGEPLRRILEQLVSVPGVHLLATSRCPIGSSVEVTYAVNPLSPEKAAQLFTERTHRVRPEFRPTASSLGPILARLGGHPLALELAAARMGVYGLAQLEAMDWMTSNEFGHFTGIAPRHRALKSVLRASIDRLESHERTVFCRLGVFRGGFDAEAAFAVAKATMPTLEMLRRLALITPDADLDATGDEGETRRFRIPEPLRELALAESHDAARSHAAYFTRWVETNRADELPEPPYEFGLRLRLQERERANVRTALETCCQSEEADDRANGLRIVAAYWTHWYIRGEGKEIETWIHRLLKGPGQSVPATIQASAQLVQGLAMRERGEREAWLATVEQAHAVLAAGPRDRNLAFAHHLCGFAYSDFARFDEADQAYEQAETIWLEIQDLRNYSVTRHNRGMLALERADIGTAEARVGEALEWFRRHQSTYQAIGFSTTGGIRLARGDIAGAAEAYRAAGEVHRRMGYVRGWAQNDRDLALCLSRLGQPNEARHTIGQALAAFRRVGDVHGEATALVALAEITGEEWHRDEARLVAHRHRLPLKGPFLANL